MQNCDGRMESKRQRKAHKGEPNGVLGGWLTVVSQQNLLFVE